MTEIIQNLFIGDQTDYDSNPASFIDWFIIHACKEPYHRRLLGYTSKGAPKNHPEYLIARRGNRLILNLVDAADYRYIPKEIIDCSLQFIDEGMDANRKILVHCNLGESRSPTIGLLYLSKKGTIQMDNYNSAVLEFMKIYPQYNPKAGMADFARNNWKEYCNNKNSI